MKILFSFIGAHPEPFSQGHMHFQTDDGELSSALAGESMMLLPSVVLLLDRLRRSRGAKFDFIGTGSKFAIEIEQRSKKTTLRRLRYPRISIDALTSDFDEEIASAARKCLELFDNSDAPAVRDLRDALGNYG